MFSMTRRRAIAGLAALGVARGQVAFAQEPGIVTIIAPAPPGGTADLTARILRAPLSNALNQSVVVENRSGGNGAIAAQAILNARPDGYTLQMTFSGFHVMSPHLVKLSYEPLKDLQAVANVVSAPQVLVV